MNRKKIILSLIILLLLATGVAAYTIMNPGSLGIGKDTDLQVDNTSQPSPTVLQSSAGTLQTETTAGTSEEETPGIVRKDEIVVEYNSPEYDLNVTLYEDSSKAIFLKLEYYYEGEGRVNTFDGSAIPEIANIFAKRDEDSSKAEAYKVRTAYLNTKLAKVYLVINSGPSVGMPDTSLYEINLSDAKVKKIFSNTGKYTGMVFNKSYRYLVYSYNDPPESSVLQEASLFGALDCYTDKLTIKNSRSADGKRIGPNVEPKTVFDYTFSVWKSEDTVELIQKPVLKDKNGKRIEKKVLYNITKNLFVNNDGSPVKTQTQVGPANVSVKAPVESGALKTLKTFYTYLSNEKEYSKAMALLDDKFTFKMAILKSFGVDELVKSDIDVESATGYSDILKSSSIETIVKEEVKNGNTTIYYYQLMGSSTSTQIKSAMIVKIGKVAKAWKIISLQDGDATKPPFVK